MRRNTALLLLTVLIGVTLVIWIQVFARESTHNLRVVFLNVGQGDAIYIETPSRRQVLIDGGRGNDVLRELGAVMAFFDRSIDIVVATHPDADHIGGLVSVLKRYDVGTFMHSSVEGDTALAHQLTDARGDAFDLEAQRGQVIDFGDGAQLRVLFPDREVEGIDPNVGSVVVHVVYGEHGFLLTGDSPDEIEEYLVSLDDEQLESDVLKIGHHGSKTSSSDLFLGFVNPVYGVLSRGCGNSYGHPHQEVLDALSRFEIKVLDTCEDGRVEFVSDGVLLRVRN